MFAAELVPSCSGGGTALLYVTCSLLVLREVAGIFFLLLGGGAGGSSFDMALLVGAKLPEFSLACLSKRWGQQGGEVTRMVAGHVFVSAFSMVS